MKKIFWTAAIALLAIDASQAAGMTGAHRIERVRFANGNSSTVIHGTVKGYDYVDYRLTASAGQILNVFMQTDNRANYFNLNAPDSGDVSMFIGSQSGMSFDAMLPDDGTYVIRVYLIRSAARRQEAGEYSLSISIEGDQLLPLPGSIDARIPGTRYHAQSTIKCAPAWSEITDCPAYVVRRSFNGTATVEVRWNPDGKRRILFVEGTPTAADSSSPIKFTKQTDLYIIDFGSDERFEIPEALVFGG